MTAGSSVACTRRSPSPGGDVENVFGGRGQVDLLMNGEPALVAREDEQGADEVLGVIDRGADVGGHGAQVAGRAVRVAQHDVDGGAHNGERGAQFMGGVGHEPLLALERGLARPSISSKVSASSRSSSRGPVDATRPDRLCSDAARAAAVIWCTGRSARPEKIQPRTAARAMTTASVISEYRSRYDRVRSRWPSAP